MSRPPRQPRTGGEAVSATPSSASELARASPVAVARGGLVALAALALGQLPPLLADLGGGGLAVGTQLKVGWLYTVATNLASIRLEAVSLEADPSIVSGVTTLRLAMLTLTLAVGWMLTGAAGAAAARVSDLAGRRAAAGVMTGIAYAVPLAILAPVVSLHLGTGGGFLPSASIVSAVSWEGAIFPFVLGVAVGALGGLRVSTWWHGRGGRIMAAGWRTFAVAMLASALGIVVFATLRPAGLDAYVAQLGSLGPRVGAITAGHQVLLLPNQAAMVLVAVMGACDTVTIDGTRTDALCLDRLPDADDPARWLITIVDERASVPTRPAPPATKLFLLVPLIAALVGARDAVPDRGRSRDAVLSAVGAALVFGALVVALTWAAAVVVTTSQPASGGDGHRITLGADPVEAGAYAAGWGILAGVPTALGVVAFRRRRDDRVL